MAGSHGALTTSASIRTTPASGRGGQAIALTPKAFDVLRYLVTHADRLVSRDALLDAVWAETAVSDTVVRMAIGEVRRALGDTAQAPRYIATVQRRGYRFVAPVTSAPPEVAPLAAAAPAAAASPPLSASVSPIPLVSLSAPRHTAPVALAGERTQVTVLFANLKDSLALIRDMDPEAAQQLVDPALHAMMDAVHRYEGTVNQVLSDGIMALFGAPIAHEDHAVRACYAALAMQAALRTYATDVHRTHGLALQSRIGLNSGEVVVRTIRNDLHMDYSAVGQTTHLAARMQQVAAPDTIVLTAATAWLAEGFVQVQALEPVPIKGMPGLVALFELHGASAIHSRFQASIIRGLTRFVGREPELAVLRQALERARAGRGQVVAVVGEPGMGKTRLAYEGHQGLRQQGWLVLESTATSYGTATPYGPVVE